MAHDPDVLPPYTVGRRQLARSSTPRSSVSRSSTRGPVEHSYSLFDSAGSPWITLKLTSTATSARYLPSYMEGQPVAGKVELNLSRNPETIRAVSVAVSGTIIATDSDPLVFWQETSTLWASEHGDPRSDSSGASSSRPKKFTGKLYGRYSWPFSITIPTSASVAFKTRQAAMNLRLPPSFSEKGVAQFINYEINVRVHRGALRIDSKLGTHFGYVIRVRPPQASVPRRLAYEDNSPLLGPHDDPDGWQVFPPIPIKGTVFGVRNIEVTCTLAMALPLIYTRGTTIPCIVELSCEDSQALDLISTPVAISLHVIRDLSYDVDDPASSSSAPSSSSAYISLPYPSPSDSSDGWAPIAPKLTHRRARKAIASAVWWPARSSLEPPNENRETVRRMEGEILLPRDTTPSFAFGPFIVKHSVILLPITATAFEPLDKEPTFVSNIEIATQHAVGPVPRSYAPSGLENQRMAHLGRVSKPMVWGLYNGSGP